MLKWCLLLLLYLFFLRVLQATWHVAAAPVGAGPRRRRAKHAPTPPAGAPGQAAPLSSAVRLLRVLEPIELSGRSFEVKGEATLGRAAACEITLDDTFVSQMHARISFTESGVVLEDLGSTNGTYLNRQKVTSAAVVQPGDQIQLGGTVLELR